jgi:peroxiredoxin
MAELQGLQSRHDEFEKRGVTVVAISADPVEANAEVVRNLGLQFRVLSDPRLVAIDAYGLRDPGAGMDGRDIARPATFLLEENGVVLWRSLTDNYRIRPRPDDILVQIPD